MEYKIQLIRQKPIKFYDVCRIYQPSFEDILNYNEEYGEEEFEKMIIPYSLTVDNPSINLTDEQKLKLTNFDLVCGLQEIACFLFLSLEYFCKSKIDFDEKGIKFNGYEGRLNQDNYDEFAKIILEILGRERPKYEKKKIFANERQRDIWEKLQEGRKRNAKKNELRLEDVLNICEFGGKYHIPIDQIEKWSLWRILNCYKVIMGISNYKDSFDLFLISGNKELIEGKHWTEVIKLDYKPPNEY